MAKRSSISIDVSVGAQNFELGPNDGSILSITSKATGLDGTGSNLDFSGSNNSGALAETGREAFGATVTLTPAAPDKSISGDFKYDYMYLAFTPGTATTGIITVTITFK